MCNFEPWKDNSIQLKDIYPIGSVLFLTQPLGNKIEWELPEQGPYELTVEWEGMTWELIVNTPTSALQNPTTVAVSSSVHTIRNVHVAYHRMTTGIPWTATLYSDESNDSRDPLSNLGKFTGENEHKLTIEEMPYHNHYGNACTSVGGHTGQPNRATWQYTYYTTTNRIIDLGAATAYTGGFNGETQYHNNKEKAYNCFIYVRIQ